MFQNLTILLSLLLTVSCNYRWEKSRLQSVDSAATELKPTYASIQQHILNVSCTDCHNASVRKGGVSLHDYDGVKEVVVEGDPENSGLYYTVAGPKPSMPRGGRPKLSAKMVEAIFEWIKNGAREK